MSSAKMVGGFSVPRTPVSPEAAAAFQRSEKTPHAFAAALVPEAAEVAPEALVAPSARLSVDVPAETLRRLKIRAIERRQTVREYVLAMLARDGL
jgi:hypothetical protein